MHTIIRRRATPNEAAVLHRATRPDPASWGCIGTLTLALVVVFAGVGALIGAVRGMMLQRSLIASTLGLLIGGVLAIPYWRYERGRRRKARSDNDAMMIEEIAVESLAAIMLTPVFDDADDPSLCIDAGGGCLVLLRGQWLGDPERLGAPAGFVAGDNDVDTANGLPEPYSFPRTRFKLTRAPGSGQVLEIELAGRYLPPSREVAALEREHGLADSVLLAGTLDDLRAALDRGRGAMEGA